ncbi:MAG: DsbE family thiol:disulfide interchange protein [Gammaproteobacteria bacterium]|nr:DsbE family thiol:disulfide interchange protein [Gammaproteobacteria bacterium]
MTRFLLPALVFAALIVFFVVGLERDPSYVPSPLIGKPAPDFELPTLADPDATFGLDDLRGQVSLLNVWATWCVGCRQEHALLVELSDSGEVPIYGLDWKDDREAALAWLEELGNPYVTTAFDETGRVAIDWGVYGAPETFLLDADATVLFKHVGPLTQQIWDEEFQPRLQAARGREQ